MEDFSSNNEESFFLFKFEAEIKWKRDSILNSGQPNKGKDPHLEMNSSKQIRY